MTSQHQWQARSHVALFVRSLHLLNLDLLEDWPGITENSFSPKSNLQQRIKCVEWSLYHLFQRYDSQISQEKLLPFFPPSSPLQSLNLRAALFRQLTELKKGGILGANVQLRKTMLDECKGERFEEVVCAFATLVLRKATNTVATLTPLVNTPSSLLPAILAYRGSLNRKLKDRDAIKLRNLEIHNNLQKSLQSLQSKRYTYGTKITSTISFGSQRLESLVKSQWLGADSGAELLMNGSISILESPKGHDDDDRIDIQQQNGSLMKDLDLRINSHNNKLRQWKMLLESLKTTLPTPSTDHGRETPMVDYTPVFRNHQDLTLSSEIVHANHTTMNSHARYEALLRSMAEEILDLPCSKKVETFPRLTSTNQVQLEDSNHSKPHALEAMRDASIVGVRQGSEELLAATGNSTYQDAVVYDTASSTGNRPLDSKSISSLEKSNASSIPKSQYGATASPTTDYQQSLQQLTIRELWSAADPTHSTAKASEEEGTDSDLSPTCHKPLSHIEDGSTLLERTRQSILSSCKSITRKGRAPNLRQEPSIESSQAAKLNTPHRPRTSIKPEQTPESGTSTPRDQLFDVDAEYASVFKSRPRIALSPAPSLQNVDHVEDSVLGDGAK